MNVTLPVNYDLIQAVRVAQALMEAGITVGVPKEHAHKFSYLANHGFMVSYSISRTNAHDLKMELLHTKPFVKIGSHEGLFLYPKQLFKKSKALWTERDQEYLFRAYPTPDRLKAAAEWMENTGLVPSVKMHNFERMTGSSKLWDEEYYRDIARSKFSVIPNGLDGELPEHKSSSDLKWTYRFLDALLCGAIPIVQGHTALYEGFEYYLMSDKEYIYDPGIAERNFEKAYLKFTVGNAALRQFVGEA